MAGLNLEPVTPLPLNVPPAGLADKSTIPSFMHRVVTGWKSMMGAGLIVIDRVFGDTHFAADAVNVYIKVPAVAVLIIAGFQVPAMPLSEVVGRLGGNEF